MKDHTPYRPSTGTEGADFWEDFCMRCTHCNPNPELKPQCDIMARSWFFEINQPQYPKEWCYVNDKPTCTAWNRWDWGNDGDPNDPDNPKAPTPFNPNQLELFPLYPDESHFEIEVKTLQPSQMTHEF